MQEQPYCCPLFFLLSCICTQILLLVQGPDCFEFCLQKRTDCWRERGITCISTAVLAQMEMLVHQHGSYQNKGKQGCIVSVPLRKTRENVFFSSCEAGEKQYDHIFVVSSRRNQHLKEFLGKEKSALEKLRPFQIS